MSVPPQWPAALTALDPARKVVRKMAVESPGLLLRNLIYVTMLGIPHYLLYKLKVTILGGTLLFSIHICVYYIHYDNF